MKADEVKVDFGEEPREEDVHLRREKRIANKILECEESAASAKSKCKKPVKLSWDDLKYTVMVRDPASTSKFRPNKVP